MENRVFIRKREYPNSMIANKKALQNARLVVVDMIPDS
jgi:hypothetical protein